MEKMEKMKMQIKNIIAGSAALLIAAALVSCSPTVGSEEWCEDLKNKDKGQWTATEVKDFAKHCILPK